MWTPFWVFCIGFINTQQSNLTRRLICFSCLEKFYFTIFYLTNASRVFRKSRLVQAFWVLLRLLLLLLFWEVSRFLHTRLTISTSFLQPQGSWLSSSPSSFFSSQSPRTFQNHLFYPVSLDGATSPCSSSSSTLLLLLPLPTLCFFRATPSSTEPWERLYTSCAVVELILKSNFQKTKLDTSFLGFWIFKQWAWFWFWVCVECLELFAVLLIGLCNKLLWLRLIFLLLWLFFFDELNGIKMDKWLCEESISEI